MKDSFFCLLTAIRNFGGLWMYWKYPYWMLSIGAQKCSFP